MIDKADLVVIGGGASGMMASIQAARRGLKTILLEHNEKLGKKLYITGKGRCNLTNDSPIDNHLANIVRNSKFMYTALNRFSPQECMNFFEDNGLKLKVERGQRVFPASDKSSDVIKVLTKLLANYGVKVVLNCEVKEVSKSGKIFNIKCSNNITYTSDSVILATGGPSYKGTGATDFGVKVAKDFGHNIIQFKSALCPIVLKDDISTLNGLSLKNVRLSVEVETKIFEEMGEMMFTYNSVTGPIALKLSSQINRLNLQNGKIYIDFKPALSDEKLEEKFLREFKQNSKKSISTYLESLLPKRFVPFFLKKSGLANKKLSEINKNERIIIKNLIKKFDFSIKSLDNIEVSIVTSGGVDVKNVKSSSCESKLVSGLYFVGELLDLDAFTGGYNLQIAWSTGYLAGNSVGQK